MIQMSKKLLVVAVQYLTKQNEYDIIKSKGQRVLTPFPLDFRFTGSFGASGEASAGRRAAEDPARTANPTACRVRRTGAL